MKTTKRILSILVAVIMISTAFGLVADPEVHAASGLPKVSSLKASAAQTSVSLSWTKLSKKKIKKVNGISIYRNGKLVKNISKKSKSYTNTGLKAGTSYSYTVKTYKNTKKKEWFNKKTQKWQKKKPAKKYRGKSRKIKKYSAGTTIRVTTRSAAPAVVPSVDPPSVDPPITDSKDPEFRNSYLPASATYDLSVRSHTFTVNSKSGVTWSSSNTAVAKRATGIDGAANPGKINFVGAGTATLTVTSKASGETKTIVLTITDSSSAGSDDPGNGESVEVTSAAYYLKYYGSSYPGEDAIDPENSMQYDFDGDEMVGNSYFVLAAYLYPNKGENKTKPVTWTIKENNIGATTELKGRNLIVKTPEYTRNQFGGKLVVEMSAEGITVEHDFKPTMPQVQLNYEELLNYNMTPDVEKAFLWADLTSVYKEEIKTTVASLTSGCTTDRQKVAKILEFIRDNFEYKEEGSSSHSVDGTWRERKGVCAGYSGLLAQMLRYADIPAGMYVLEKSYNHAVTVFWMDGAWYGADGSAIASSKHIVNGGYAPITKFETVGSWRDNPLPGGVLYSK